MLQHLCRHPSFFGTFLWQAVYKQNGIGSAPFFATQTFKRDRLLPFASLPDDDQNGYNHMKFEYYKSSG
ncbi:MAG: hypothetical protein JRE72_05075 [Deltaproteobacteria bacterium]|nr:hypothetical protein [Deltaproteobacteria bacterium]